MSTAGKLQLNSCVSNFPMGTPFCVDAKYSEVIRLSLYTDVHLRDLHCRDIFEEIKRNRVRFYVQFQGQRGLWWYITDQCELESDLDSFGIQSMVLFAALGLSLSWDVFHSQTSMVTVMSAARASEPHQAGISKLLSWVFRNGETKDKGRLLATCPFCSPFEVS